MSFLNRNTGLYTDHYELSMAQGYFFTGRQNVSSCFDYFSRKNPFKGGYTIFAGLNDLLKALEDFRFDEKACSYLLKIGFDEKFVKYLSNFRFKGNVYSVKEGEVVFPDEPVLRIEGNVIETQVVETMVLNILNFESLIATKASRMREVAGKKLLIDFGLRRSQGLGGIHASRAAIIGGFDKTSNLYSAKQFNLVSSGTMAHSWVQTYGDELEAFRKFAEYYPNTSILLVDTYDTLKSGVPNAIKVAKELEEKGYQLQGIRLDSGDLAYLSKQARKMLDKEGLEYVKIAASNQLDEHIIHSLLSQQKAPIDVFGVGTALVTGKDDPALDGVYKIAMFDEQPTMKVTENITKNSLPGIKNIYRYFDKQNCFYADAICLNNENQPQHIFHPHYPGKNTGLKEYTEENIIHPVMKEEKKVEKFLSPVEESAEYAKKRLKQLPKEHKRFVNPHIYKVGISKKLLDLRDSLIKDYKKNNNELKKEKL